MISGTRSAPPLYSATGDLRATQTLLGHASRVTTDRYTLAAVPGRLKVAVSQVEKPQGRNIVAVRCGSTQAGPCKIKKLKHAPVAQLDRASAF